MRTEFKPWEMNLWAGRCEPHWQALRGREVRQIILSAANGTKATKIRRLKYEKTNEFE